MALRDPARSAVTEKCRTRIDTNFARIFTKKVSPHLFVRIRAHWCRFVFPVHGFARIPGDAGTVRSKVIKEVVRCSGTSSKRDGWRLGRDPVLAGARRRGRWTRSDPACAPPDLSAALEPDADRLTGAIAPAAAHAGAAEHSRRRTPPDHCLWQMPCDPSADRLRAGPLDEVSRS